MAVFSLSDKQRRRQSPHSLIFNDSRNWPETDLMIPTEAQVKHRLRHCHVGRKWNLLTKSFDWDSFICQHSPSKCLLTYINAITVVI